MTVLRAGLPKKNFLVERKNIPTTLTDEATLDTYIETITVTNDTAGALTVTLQDRQATPVKFLSSASIAANSTSVITFERPHKFKGGVSWSASAAGLRGSLEGVTRLL
jgi:phage terminase large subunit-like protein